MGLKPDSDADAVITGIVTALRPGTALAAEQPDPSRFVPIDAVKELLAEHSSHMAVMRESDAKAKVDGALRGGYITPAMRGWATALCMQDAESFDKFIAASPAPWAHLHRELMPGLPPGSVITHALASDDETAICAQLGLKPGTLSSV